MKPDKTLQDAWNNHIKTLKKANHLEITASQIEHNLSTRCYNGLQISKETRTLQYQIDVNYATANLIKIQSEQRLFLTALEYVTKEETIGYNGFKEGYPVYKIGKIEFVQYYI